MPQPHIYLDYNATAPIRPAVITAMAEAMGSHANPSSVHTPGREARKQLEAARQRIGAYLSAGSADIIFTSGGTEADSLALTGMRGDAGGRALVSAIEHDAVLSARPDAERIPVSRAGVVDLSALEAALSTSGPDSDSPPDSPIVSVMWANNETGAIQPIPEAVEIAHRHRALIHSDAVQALGKLAVDFTASGLDMMSLSAHKIGGPPGVGALLIREGLALSPQMRGGGQERGRRGGTENLPGIIGFAAAIEALTAEGQAEAAAAEALRDQFEAALMAAAPAARILSRGVERLGNTSCVTMPGVAAETQVMAFDLDGIAVSAGSACSSGKVTESHVIAAMDPGDAASSCSVRISFGRTNRAADIDSLIAAWCALYARANPS